MINIPGYTIHKKIGSGGMAVVYLATQNSLQRDVALKVMRNTGDSDSNYKERFIHEGHDLASVEHPNIATIYDISHTDEYYYYAMEYLKGGSLSQRLDEGVSLVEAFNIIIQIGYALDCAHRNNIIHRDLKPSNILFRDDNTPILTDFGIAKNIARETKLTKTGSLLGTPWYMSPEQCRGLPIDGRADLYSLAVLFFELITGHLPFDADDSIAIAMKQITEPVPLLPENLSSLQSIFDIALDKEPSERFPTVADFCDVLKEKLNSDDLIQQHMNDMTQKISHDAVIDASARAAVETLDLEHSSPISALNMPSEQEFWEQKSPIRRWFFYSLLLATLIFAGHHYYYNYYLPQSNSETARFLPVLMRQAERQISVSQIFEPPGNNVYETLSKVLAMDPSYQPARLMLEDMATSFEIRARDYLLEKDFINVKKQIALGVKFSPNHQGLSAVSQLLQEALDNVEKQKAIEKKLVQVETLYSAKQYYKPENKNALLKINEILAIDKSNLEALSYVKKIESIIVAEFEAAIIESQSHRKRIYPLSNDIYLALKVLPQSNKILSISQKVNAIIEQQEKSAEIARLLTLAKQQLKESKLYNPENDNAYATYVTVLALEPSNIEAKRKLKLIVDELEKVAQKLYTEKKYTQALVIVDKGLSAIEEQLTLLALKQKIYKRINENNDVNQKRFSMASEFLEQNNILFPKNNNAYELIQLILKDSPNDVATNQLLNSLPDRLVLKIKVLIDKKDFSEVDKLYQSSLNVFPNNKKLLELKVLIHEKKELTSLINTFDLLLASEIINAKQSLSAIKLLSNAQVYSGDTNLISKGLILLSDKLKAQVELNKSIGSLSEIKNINLELQMLLQKKMSDNKTIELVISQLDKLKEIEIAYKQSLQVEVTVNALPWGKLVSVIDNDGNNVDIVENTVTPLKLKLIPGDYHMVLTNPAYKLHQRLGFKVSKKQTDPVIATFERLTAKDFFKDLEY